MFSHLVESDPHTGEFKRKGKFFLATMVAYALVLMVTGVVGVYAYEAHIDDQKNLELIALVPPDTEEIKPKEVEPVRRTNTQSAPANQGSARSNGGLIKNTPTNVSTDLTKISGAARAATTQPPPIVSDGSGRTFDPGTSNPFGVGTRRGGGDPSGTGENGDGILREDAPRIEKKAPETPAKKTIVSLGVINGRAISKPDPVYPQLAKAAGIEGVVTVELLIDEAGRVLSAHATGGHPLLRQEAERAALRTRFTPSTLSNQPVKVKGIITFNFILRK
jgi:TonB family protein